MQLVLSGKRVIGYGENLLATGGTVVNLDTEKVYQNATIAECECYPCDIDKVGYEFYNGEFIPCAPYGEGKGNVAVWCDECKKPLDSGLTIDLVGKVFITNYTGSGTDTVSITCGFKPRFVHISRNSTKNNKTVVSLTSSSNRGAVMENGAYKHSVDITQTETGITISDTGVSGTINSDADSYGTKFTYTAILIG